MSKATGTKSTKNKASPKKAATTAGFSSAQAASARPTRNEAALQGLISGLAANEASLDALVLPSGQFTPAELVARFQSGVSAIQGAQAAKVAWRNAVAAQDATMSDLRPVMESLTMSLRSRYGAKSLVLEQFGIKPLIKAQPTAAVKAAAVAKGLATKAAKKAKLAPASPAAAASIAAPAATH